MDEVIKAFLGLFRFLSLSFIEDKFWRKWPYKEYKKVYLSIIFIFLMLLTTIAFLTR